MSGKKETIPSIFSAFRMGEFFTLSAMYKFWMQEEDPSFQKHPKSVDNGVQCLLADTTVSIENRSAKA